MGGITSVLTALPAVIGSVNTVASRRQEKKEWQMQERQLAQNQALQEQQAASAAALEREQMALNTQAAEEERRSALKRAVARQRANFGAQGVGSGGGSSQAVLLGPFEESEAEKARREQMDNLRLRIVEDDVSARRASNILQRTQLAERNRLEATASRYNNLTNNLSRIVRGRE